MSYYLKNLFLSGEAFESYILNHNSSIRNLSKINLFVGSNNSGKSRFMRNIYKLNSYQFETYELDLNELNSLIKEYKREIKSIIENFRLVDYGDILRQVNNIQEFEMLNSEHKYLDDFQESVNYIMNLNNKLPITYNGSAFFYDNHHESIRNGFNMLGEKYHLLLEKMFVGIPNIFRFDKVYIPTLRGLRPFSAGEDVYFYRTVNDYYNGNDKENVFTGLNLYDEIRDLLLGDLTEREIVADFQKFLGEVFFHGEEIALIPSKNSDVLKVKIGREKEEAIYNLGDGIQSLIILTFPLFLNRDKNMLVFIEEPELFLHPGLQRKLLETFMEFDKNQYFISTHSNHFLDLSLDINKISIYSFNKQLDNTDHNNREKVPKFVIDNVSNENNSLLEMLGVKKSSVFLSNCTIWVEGITDRYYIRHYLDLYQKSLGHNNSNNFKEDLHFSFVEYSGGNITHWSFLDDEEESEHDNDDIFRSMNVDKVCAKLFLVTDKDSDNKFERQEKLRSKLKERYYCLECKEIENLLSKEVLMEVIAEYEKTEANELQFKRKFSYENYKNKYLGKFIDNIIVNKRRKANYGQGSGTINGKVKFCQIAIKHIQVFDDLTDEAKELTRRIYMFIKEHNN